MRVMPRLALLAATASIVLLAAGAADAQSALLKLESVFGQPASALTMAFGTVDVECMATPAAGVTCVQATGGTSATWYGTVRFSTRVTGMGQRRVRLVGARQSAGTMPTGALRDGAAGTVPTIAYPIEPAGLTLASAIGAGNTTINRSVGIYMTRTDAAGAWSTPVVYSLIVE